jgi:hypothetical protein
MRILFPTLAIGDLHAHLATLLYRHLSSPPFMAGIACFHGLKFFMRRLQIHDGLVAFLHWRAYSISTKAEQADCLVISYIFMGSSSNVVIHERAWIARLELPPGVDSPFPGHGEVPWLPEDPACRAAGPWREVENRRQ